jgi:uncharacterized spore protein YtfJ
MSLTLEETVQKLTDFLKTEAKTETVIGQPFQIGEFTCVPVIKFGIGMGYGGGEGHGGKEGKGNGEGTGIGGGGGIGVEPMGFLATRGGEISFIPTRTGRGLSAIFEKVPDMIEKMMKKKESEAVKN